MRRLSIFAIAFVAIVVVVAGCSGGDDGGSSRRSKFDVGGAVAYCADGAPLASVTVNVTDVDGNVETATTSSNGLWKLDSVHQGIYAAEYVLAGYQTELQSVVVAPDQVAGSDVAFVDAGSPCLSEVIATATIAPFGLTIENGQTIINGVTGAAAVYSKSSATDIVLTFDRPFILPVALGGPQTPLIRDANTGVQIFGAFSGGNTVVTFSAAQLAGMNASAGLTSNGALALHTLTLQGPQYTPINGTFDGWSASVKFDAVP